MRMSIYEIRSKFWLMFLLLCLFGVGLIPELKCIFALIGILGAVVMIYNSLKKW